MAENRTDERAVTESLLTDSTQEDSSGSDGSEPAEAEPGWADPEAEEDRDGLLVDEAGIELPRQMPCLMRLCYRLGLAPTLLARVSPSSSAPSCSCSSTPWCCCT